MLQFEPDSSLADWFAQRDEPWEQLVTMGPTGFESYARVRYLDEDRISQGVLYGRLRVYLAGETKTPGDCFHALWDGSVSSMYGDALRGTSPWFPAGVLSGPKLRVPQSLPIPARQYMLFRGPSKRSATGAPGNSPPARPKTTNFQHHTFCGRGTTGGSSPRTWTPTSPRWAGPEN